MIDYDLVKKAKDIYKQVDDFDRKWMSARGAFNLLNKAGAISDEDLQAVTTEYDRIMAPVTKAQQQATAYVVDKGMRFLWNSGLVEKKSD